MSARIRFLIEGVNMNAGHNGLTAVLKKELHINPHTLLPGDLVMFINKKGDKLKVLGTQGIVLAYLKMPGGQKIYKEALQYLPATFGAGGFNYDRACKTALEKRLDSVKRKKDVTIPFGLRRIIRHEEREVNAR